MSFPSVKLSCWTLAIFISTSYLPHANAFSDDTDYGVGRAGVSEQEVGDVASDDQWMPATEWEASGEQLTLTISDEVVKLLGRGSGPRRELDARLTELKKQMKDLFAVMPKNEEGLLGHTTVRYALHRFFLRGHSWFVDGLDPHGEAWNASSPTELLRGHISDHVRGLFELRLMRGFDLADLALMAGTFEFLVKAEAEVRLAAVYHIYSTPLLERVGRVDAVDILSTHMATLLLRKSPEQVREYTVDMLPALHKRYHTAYPNYVEIDRLIEEAMKSFYSLLPAAASLASASLSFHNVSTVLEEVNKKYGQWSGHTECSDLKQLLLTAEEGNTGCVKLSSFYGDSPTLKDAWQFKEAPDFLRELGSLSESNKNDPHVIVPNYIQGYSNCLASSEFFSLCCQNECEPLFESIEGIVKAPEAEPAVLVETIRTLSTASIKAPRSLSPALTYQLHEIAWNHKGKVPLHGRLFAQWMHHAFPRECQYPHIAGSSHPHYHGHGLDMKERSKSAASYGKMSASSKSLNQTCTPWQNIEELLVEVPAHWQSLEDLEKDDHIWAGMKSSALLGLMVCMLLRIMWSTLAIRKKISGHTAAGLASK